MQAHNLAMFASTCKLSFKPNHQYIAEFRHRLVIPENLKKWQVFDSHKKINIFFTLDEFVNSNIDTNIELDFDYTDEVEINKVEHDQIDRFHPTKFTKSDFKT